MFIDDKLRKSLVENAEKLGISVSILLDWARAKNDEDYVVGLLVELLRDGMIEVAEVRNQEPAFRLTKQGEIKVASLRQENSSTNRSQELYLRPRGH